MPRFSRFTARLGRKASTTSFTSLSEASIYQEDDKDDTIVECTEIILEDEEEGEEEPVPEKRQLAYYHPQLVGQRFGFKSSPEMGVKVRSMIAPG